MGWIIAASIVLFFALLLAGKVTVYFDYTGELAVKIKYMCFTVVRIPKKEKKRKRPKKEKRKKKAKIERAEKTELSEKSDEKQSTVETAEKSEKKKPADKKANKKTDGEQKKKKLDLKSLTFDDMIALLKLAFSSVRKPLRKLFKSIVFSHMCLRAVCGGDDAAKTAIKYGALNMAAGNVLGLLDSYFTLKPLDDMYIGVDFQNESSEYDVYFEVRLTMFAAVAAGVKLLAAFLKLVRAYKKKSAANIALRKAAK